MAEIDLHGQLKWDEKTEKAHYVVAWPLTKNTEPVSGKIVANFVDSRNASDASDPIHVQACYVPSKGSTTIIAADSKIEVTIPESSNGGEAGLYAAVTIGYDMPSTDPLPTGYEVQNGRTYYVTALKPPSNSSGKGQELKEMPEGAEIQLKVLAEGCDLCRLVEYKDDEGEVGSKWKSVKDPSKVRYLGTFALVSNGSN